jgi:hypothetical protein
LAGDWFSDVVGKFLSVRWLPVPAGGDLGGGPLVPAVRPVRDVEELLAERGVTVDHVTVYRWVQRFTPEFIEAGCAVMRPATGGSPTRLTSRSPGTPTSRPDAAKTTAVARPIPEPAAVTIARRGRKVMTARCRQRPATLFSGAP